MVCDRALIFHMCISCGKTFSLVQRSMSPAKVKVKYQGHSFKDTLTLAIVSNGKS